MTKPVFSLRIHADMGDLAAIRQFVKDKGHELNARPDAITDLVLALDEAVTNVLMHSYSKAGGPLEIDIRCEGRAITIHLRDQAPLFDPTAVPPPDLSLPVDQRPIGKLGLYLIRDCMDEVAYRVTPQGHNELILVKQQAVEESL